MASINIENFYETSLLSSYKGTIFDIDFNPKQRYSNIELFFADLRPQLYLNLIECLEQPNQPMSGLRVFMSVDFEHNETGVRSHDYKVITSAGRPISEASKVEAVICQAQADIIYILSRWIADFPFVMTSVLSANLHIVSYGDTYISPHLDLGIVRRHARFGPKFRYAIVDKKMMGIL